MTWLWFLIPSLLGFFAGKIICEQTAEETSEDSEVDDA